MSTTYYERNKEKIREYQKKYYEENKERIKQLKRKWDSENREKIREYVRKQTEKAFKEDPEKVRAARRLRKAKQKAKDPVRYNAMANAVNKKQYRKMVDELWDCYVRRLLCKHEGVLSAKDIPQELIEAKRLEVQIRRMVNEKRN